MQSREAMEQELATDVILIFLDIDGVLLTEYDKFNEGGIPGQLRKKYLAQGIPMAEWDTSSEACDKEAVNLFHKQAVENLNNLIQHIEQTGNRAAIVISSDWRRQVTLSALQNLFKQHAFAKHIIDKTYDSIYLRVKEFDFDRTLSRGEEIEVWLQENRSNYKIKNHVILDDYDSYISDLFKKNFVHCKSGFFNEKNLKEAIEIINKPIENSDFPYNNLMLFVKPTYDTSLNLNVSMRLIPSVRKELISKTLLNLFNMMISPEVRNNRKRKRDDTAETISNLIAEYDTKTFNENARIRW